MPTLSVNAHKRTITRANTVDDEWTLIGSLSGDLEALVASTEKYCKVYVIAQGQLQR